MTLLSAQDAGWLYSYNVAGFVGFLTGILSYLEFRIRGFLFRFVTKGSRLPNKGNRIRFGRRVSVWTKQSRSPPYLAADVVEKEIRCHPRHLDVSLMWLFLYICGPLRESFG